VWAACSGDFLAAQCPGPGGLNAAADFTEGLPTFMQSHYRRIPAALVLVLGMALAVCPARAQSVNPGSVWFGFVIFGETGAPKMVTLVNRQNSSLTINSIGVTGADFSQTNTCLSSSGEKAALAPGKSCTMRLTFTPKATGMRYGALEISTSASSAPQSIRLSAASVFAVKAAPLGLWFGSQGTGTSSRPQTITLSNSSYAKPLTLSSITASGDYKETNTCTRPGSASTTLNPGASCTITVTFAPQSAGRRTGQILITDNAGNSPQHISLAGEGLQASLAIAPAAGNLQPGSRLQFTASGSAPDTTIIWAVNGVPGGAPDIGMVTAGGLYTAPARAGTYTVSAVSSLGSVPAAQARITVGSAAVAADFGSRQSRAYPIAASLIGAGLGGGIRSNLPAPIAQAGLINTRFHANIQDVYASSTPNWSYLDSELSAFAASGMKVILEMDYTPSSLQPRPNPCPSGIAPYHALPTDMKAFAGIAASFVSHIDAKFPGVVNDYEIWNEPDGGGLCAGDNSSAAKLNAYLSIYAAVAPALRAAAERDGVQIRVGGPTLGSVMASAPTWIPALLTNSGTSSYVDFVSMHYYISSPTDVKNGLSWAGSGSAPSLLGKTQDSKYGIAAVYQEVAALVHGSQPASSAPMPIYVDEYNEDWGFVNDCCRNDATYSPLWNSLVFVDLLDSVYSGAPAAPARILYYAISNPPFCLIGQNNSAMDCGWPYSSPASAQPYPQYYAMQLFASQRFLGLNGGAFLASSVNSANADLHVAAFYTPTADTIVIVNTSSNDYANIPVLANNPGGSSAQATTYLLNAGNPQIATESTPLTASGSGFVATVSIPAHSVLALSLQVSPQ
jgi:hypothetical protein